ncbi:hypothetical protein D7Z54_16990 [Salibacterium salarium]|uniref:Uncharacterized protein n=1 Tax=Salibacterium salarium TaxID=284579 RepID=A0A3R9PJH1_9BACI|nr:hypothetical protein [Salibacterium salarium]RSL32124.1 hypothetical protein D7Z54_16990 [Salibacterium salarium]
MKPFTEIFKINMTLLTFIAFVSHFVVLIISDWDVQFPHKDAVVVAMFFAMVPFFLFILVPSFFILRLKIPTFLQYILFVVSSYYLFQSLSLLGDGGFSSLVGADYAIISIISFCAFHLYGIISKEMDEEEEAESD